MGEQKQSKKVKRRRGSQRGRVGLDAKAGRRKIYKGGRRKVRVMEALADFTRKGVLTNRVRPTVHHDQLHVDLSNANHDTIKVWREALGL